MTFPETTTPRPTQQPRNVRYDLREGDYTQWREYDGEVIAVDREAGFVTAECYDGDEAFTVNIADTGRQLSIALDRTRLAPL